MRLSVVVPVHNGGQAFAECLRALGSGSRVPDEVIVVDDGSTDGSAEIAAASNARVIRLSGPAHGPAYARNRGAEVASGELLVFIDSDVAVHGEALARFAELARSEPAIAAFFGSYDDNPSDGGLVSQYKNLFHHYVHQHGRRQAFTFWAGLGAIRREAFAAAGGFDEGYLRPSIEDIALGARLRALGYGVMLCPQIQGTHHKRWTLAGLLCTDIRDRAVPWSRLLLRGGRVPADLNLDLRSRLSAGFAWAAALGLAASCLRRRLLLPTLAFAAALVALNRGLYSFFARRRGVLFAIAGAGLHCLYLLYSSATFAVVAAQAWANDRNRQ